MSPENEEWDFELYFSKGRYLDHVEGVKGFVPRDEYFLKIYNNK
jgi:hypothetical protein